MLLMAAARGRGLPASPDRCAPALGWESRARCLCNGASRLVCFTLSDAAARGADVICAELHYVATTGSFN
jgi:hypothetical protein